MFRIIVSSFIITAASWAASSDNPDGTWATQINGNDRGVCYLTFATNSIETGYGISLDSNGSFLLGGTWSIDKKGKLTGGFTKTNDASSAGTYFVGKVSKNQLTASVFSSEGRYNFKGVPTDGATIADLSGTWTATVNEGSRKFFMSFTAALSTNLPAWYEISGTGNSSLGPFTMTGAIVITPDNRCAGYTTYNYGSSTRQDTLVGHLTKNGKKLVLRGHTENNGPANLQAEPDAPTN
jgi:hypothetical protein